MKLRARSRTIIRDNRIAGYIGVVLDEQGNMLAETPMYGLRQEAYNKAQVLQAIIETTNGNRKRDNERTSDTSDYPRES